MNRFRQSATLILRGIVVAGAAGACVGLADVVRALLAGREFVRPGDEIAVVAFYAACFAPLGALAALAAANLEAPRRALRLLVVVAAALFFVGALVNVTLLPEFTTGASLAFDAVLVVAGVVGFRAFYRQKRADDAGGMLSWPAAGIAAAGSALLLSILVPPRDEGPAPRVTVTASSQRPNVLVYLVDTLRADRLGHLGYGKPTSPEIDAFAADATVFTDCRSVTSWTKPAVASLMTSQYPSVHACIEEGQVLVPAADTLAEVFRAAGWRTAAFVDNPFISPEFGFGQGIGQDDFRYHRPSVVANGTLLGRALVVTRVLPLVGKRFGFGEHVERGAAALHRELLTSASAKPEQPWLAYVHAMEPHAPYNPRPADAEAMGLPSGTAYLAPPLHDGILPFQQSPEPTADALTTLQAQYDGEIRGLSREFGAILDELRRRGMLETTIVVLLADHGEEFHEHGGWQHGHSLHREVTQVPLIVRLPDSLGAAANSSRGLRVGGVATLLDVAPTLVELAGIQYPAHQSRGGSGISLVPNLLAADGGTPLPVPERRLLGQVTKHRAVIHSLREGRWQLIVAYEPKSERLMLFDDSSDPGHLHDLATAELLVAGQLRRNMAESFGVLEKVALEPRARDIDAETAAKLRALGYVGGN